MNFFYCPPLILAVKKSNEEIVRLLLENEKINVDSNYIVKNILSNEI